VSADISSHRKCSEVAMKVRKRGGELVIDGSGCDRRKFILRDWLALAFVAFFMAITHALLWQKVWFIDFVRDQFQLSVDQMNNLENLSIALLNAKIFADQYRRGNATPFTNFEGEDLGTWLKDWIVNFNSSNENGIFGNTINSINIDEVINNPLPTSEKVL
jgi:hypothetical protein